MGPRKRPKTATSSVKCNKQNPEKRQCLPENSCSNRILPHRPDADEKSYLFLLPNEVLLYIYNFLSPVDLLALTELKNKRLTDLTYTVSEANLSSCRRANPLYISHFFTRIRVKYITKLNLNYYFYMKPIDIVKLIGQCKNLTSLFVVECGLTCKNIISILKKCRKLEELAWNAEEITFDKIFSRIKRLHLFCDNKACSRTNIYFAMRFLEVENVWVHFVPDSVLPFIGLWLWASSVTRNLILTVSTLEYAYVTSELRLMEQIFDIRSSNSNEFYQTISIQRSRRYNNPPYLQIRSEAEDISLLSSGPFDKYSTISIIVTSEIINVSDSLIKCVKEIAGDKLRHLSLQSEAQRFTSRLEPLPIESEEAIAVCDVLEKMFLSSKYITMLNLTTVHCSAGSPIKAITQLIYLKVLSISSCAFGNSAKAIDSQSIELSNVVSCCPKIEDFTLNCCVNDSDQLTEDDVVCIKDWLHLKHLSIYCLVFRTCNFLQNVADSCVKLQSLSLITVAPGKTCLFTNNVIYLLKKAKDLRLIRINEERFFPEFERFWTAIGESINLEAICIITQSRSYVHTQTVIKEIKKLKYLHMFHFYSPRVSDSFYSEAKKSMRQNGVNNIRVEKTWDSKTARPGLGSCVYYYHKPPHFCCQNLHLKDYNLF